MRNNGGADGSGAGSSDVAAAVADALVEHEYWLCAFQRAVTCRLPADETVTSRQAHDRCRFGRWLRHGGDGIEGQDEALRQLARSHRHLHDVARLLAEKAAADGAPRPEEYDTVMQAAADFREAAARVQEHCRGAETDLAPDDRLTELEGRLTMMSELERERERALRTGMPVTLVFVRPHGFDDVAFEHGRAGIDRIVVTLAARIFGLLRPYDGIYRYGRSDFMICLPGTSPQQARRIAERLLGTLLDNPVAIADEVQVEIAARIGIAAIDGRTSVQESLDHAVRVADLAVAGGDEAIAVWDPRQGG